ncbi:MAG: hypothetical protein JXB17_05985 [Bacteroidales bacterium]|nr:hypothetical protein [Bacteroidales bacterium]
MGISQEKYNLFADYINNNLSEQEIIDFEKKLNEDKEFANDYRNFKIIVEGIEKSGEESFIQQLKEIDKQIPEPVILKTNYRRILAYAAIIIILIGIGSIIFLTSKTNTDKLYLAYFDHYKNDLVEYSRGVPTESPIKNLSVDDYMILTEAMRYYDKKDYEKTIEIIENRLITNTDCPGIIFFLAVSQLETNRFDEAIDNFKFLIQYPVNDYYEQSNWYLNLAYLKNGDIEKAKLGLKEIILKNSRYKKNAQELLNDLK